MRYYLWFLLIFTFLFSPSIDILKVRKMKGRNPRYIKRICYNPTIDLIYNTFYFTYLKGIQWPESQVYLFGKQVVNVSSWVCDVLSLQIASSDITDQICVPIGKWSGNFLTVSKYFDESRKDCNIQRFVLSSKNMWLLVVPLKVQLNQNI